MENPFDSTKKMDITNNPFYSKVPITNITKHGKVIIL